MSFEVTGKVHHIGELEVIGEKAFKKQVLVLEVQDGKYPEFPVLEFQGERTAELQKCKVGDNVKVAFQLAGRGVPYNSKYYGTVKAWKLDVVGEETQQPAPAPKATQAPAAPKPAAPKVEVPVGEDDLPF